MLNKGLRDEEKIRIDNVLKTLRTLVFVPYPLTVLQKTEIENQLKEFGLNIQSLIDYSNEDLITFLTRLFFDWEQLELFADILVEFSITENYNFENKALAVYQYIQTESKVFSFGINTKIASLKNKQ
jgi:predicted Abi (CAAX) family protease